METADLHFTGAIDVNPCIPLAAIEPRMAAYGWQRVEDPNLHPYFEGFAVRVGALALAVVEHQCIAVTGWPGDDRATEGIARDLDAIVTAFADDPEATRRQWTGALVIEHQEGERDDRRHEALTVQDGRAVLQRLPHSVA
jgi:hypothetical protein